MSADSTPQPPASPSTGVLAAAESGQRPVERLHEPLAATGSTDPAAAATRPAIPAEVARLHQSFLGRAAREEEIAAHVGQDILLVATGLAASEEHRTFMRAARAEDAVRLYREILGRDPENDLVVAAHVGRPLFDAAMEFAHSDEFRARARAATAADIHTIHRRLLDREPETEAAVEQQTGRSIMDVAIETALSTAFQARTRIQEHEIQEFCALFLGSAADDAWVRELARILRFHQIRLVALVDNLLGMHLRRRGIAAADDTTRLGDKPPHVHLREQPDYAPTRHFGTKITLVVPTINSENWLLHLIAFYDAIGVRPLYAVDSRTTDSTRDILASSKKNWIEVTAEAERVEALLPAILSNIDTPWVLRLDDDELPSAELLRFADDTADDTADAAEVPVWGFQRLALRWHPGRAELAYSGFFPFGPYFDRDRQWRLFRPAEIRLDTDLHTPGIVSDRMGRATPGGYILHFDWVLRTLARRQQKMANYEAQAAKARNYRHHVLYEMIPEEWHRFEILADPRLRDFARKIYHASY